MRKKVSICLFCMNHSQSLNQCTEDKRIECLNNRYKSFKPLPEVLRNFPNGSNATWEYSEEFAKLLAKIRDHETCAICRRSKQIEVHHIQERCHHGSNHPRNLICMCTKCHDVIHAKKLRKAIVLQVEQAKSGLFWKKIAQKVEHK